MTYAASEQSVKSGRPKELYDFAMDGEHWCLTSCPVDVSYNGKTYISAPVKRTKLKPNLEIELPRGHELSNMCLDGTLEKELTLTLHRGHSGYYVTYWRGNLVKAKFDKNDKPFFSMMSKLANTETSGGQRKCQRQCDLCLYGYRCGLNRENYKITGTLETVNGITLVSDDFEQGEWSVDKEVSGIIYGDITSLPDATYYASSSYIYNRQGYSSYAFDNNINSYWTGNGESGPQTIGCRWDTPRIVNLITINTPPVVAAAKNIKIEASNDGSGWAKLPITGWAGKCQQYNTDEATLLWPMYASERAELTLSNSSAYKYYRVYCSGPYGQTKVLVTAKQFDDLYLISITEIEMTYTDYSDGDFPELIGGLGAGGSIVIGDEERSIMSHQGDTITINRPFRYADIGSAFSAYAGCDHSPKTCRFKFNNIVNYGGKEFLPVNNPFIRNIFY